MPRRARLLYTLQRVDIQLARKGRRYKEVEAHLGESEALRDARATLEAATRDHAHWRAQAQDRELEAQSIADKLSATEERLYSGRITNPRELGDLLTAQPGGAAAQPRGQAGVLRRDALPAAAQERGELGPPGASVGSRRHRHAPIVTVPA